MQLTAENYYGAEANKEYFSASQIKQFRKCQAAALAEIKGEWEREKSTALMVGSYVDAYFESKESFRSFLEQNEKLIYKKGGEPRSEYALADKMIDRAEQDVTFMTFMQGDHQTIVTGYIADVPMKAKLDVYFPGERIVDLKTTKDLESTYVPGRGRVSFAEAWDWDLQMAIYQELVRQQTGEQLPCYLAVITKQDPPDIEVVSIPQDILDANLQIVKEDLPLFDAIKSGLVEPERCEKCEYCRKTKKLYGAKPLTLFMEG